MKIGFYTLGCKVNQFETQALAQLAAARGYLQVDTDADIFLINTCTVTSVSEQKNLRAIRRIRRDNPHAVIA
ncbi:MAG: tRNA (N(6)-L-threonylcarbamoyladenosine(37)-C(2))-methylthiotransferase MtaB, partial [Butyricicoccaceae bacterium]